VGIWWEFGGNLKRENRKEMGGKFGGKFGGKLKREKRKRNGRETAEVGGWVVSGVYFRGFGTGLELSWEFGGNLVGI